MSKQFTLGKKERLKSRKQIELLFNEGKKFVLVPFRIFYQFKNESSTGNEKNTLQFGVGVSVKNFKKAVDRNRVKRVTREAWRLQKNELKKKLLSADQQLNVFIIYTSKELPVYQHVKEKVAIALEILSKKINENDSSNS